MKTFPLGVALLLPLLAQADGGALSGQTGLLTIPTAETLDEGSVRVGVNRHDTVQNHDHVVNYLFSVGFAPGLELGGRIVQNGPFESDGDGLNDLSFNAKLRLWKFDNGLSFAVGAQDIGGEAQNFRGRQAVATLPWHTLSLTAGYQWGPDVPHGTLGGLEWRPWRFLGLYAEYDAEEVNPGLKLQSPPLWGGLTVGANAGWRSASDEVEGGIELSIPLGRRKQGGMGMPPYPQPAPSVPQPAPPVGRQSIADAPNVRAALERLGFESVRSGTRPDGTLAVSLENRRYNHSSADGIGLALGTIAAHAPEGAERVELNVSAYGVPQVALSTGTQAYRDFLAGGAAADDLLDIRYSAGTGAGVTWHNPAPPLTASELVIEPVLRSFLATEYGVADVGLGARARFTAPLSRGLVAHFGMQVPLALTDDFHDGQNFQYFAPESGLDLMLLQYAYKALPSWTWLWSIGRMQVIQTDLSVVGVEQAWTSAQGRHRLNTKLMVMDSGVVRHEVALAGYTMFDATRRYSVGVTGGRFYAGDSGARLDLSRYFGDTIVGLFLKVEGRENMAGGFSLSLPLTPRQDAMPRGVQIKGARRWAHSQQTTLNLADGTNTLKPLLLYEPAVDFDLRRDFLDSGRLGPEYLRSELPRMREAYQLWGQ